MRLLAKARPVGFSYTTKATPLEGEIRNNLYNNVLQHSHTCPLDWHAAC